MSAITPPIAKAEMLIRRSAAQVFRAFTDPSETANFWFTRGSAPLEAGKTVTWHWDMYGASAEVKVIAVERHHRLLIEWPTPVEWTFSPRGSEATLVTIVASGFIGSEDEQVVQAIDSMGGFSLVLAGCKAWLEHGVRLNLVEDHNPDHHVRLNDES